MKAHEFLDDILKEIIFAKDKIKTAFELGAEIGTVERELHSLFCKQEDLMIYEETRIDHLNLLICQNQIATVSDRLSELKKQKEALE